MPPVLAQGRATAATAEIATTSLRGGVSALMGSGGNIAVLPVTDGNLLVDSGYETSRAQLTVALAALSADPLTYLIHRHWHFDHTDGNAWMHEAGATIIAQEQCKVRLSTTQTMAALHAGIRPRPFARFQR